MFLLHLILSTWGMESAYTVPTSYLYTNVVLMGTLIWTITSVNSIEPIAMTFLVNIAVFGLDIIALSLYWPGGRGNRIYLGFAIANTILRPFTCLLLYRIFRERDIEGVGIRGLFLDLLPTNAEAGGTSAQSSQNPGAGHDGYEPIHSSTLPTKA